MPSAGAQEPPAMRYIGRCRSLLDHDSTRRSGKKRFASNEQRIAALSISEEPAEIASWLLRILAMSNLGQARFGTRAKRDRAEVHELDLCLGFAEAELSPMQFVKRTCQGGEERRPCRHFHGHFISLAEVAAVCLKPPFD